jgi:YD repeat-containing protein
VTRVAKDAAGRTVRVESSGRAAIESAYARGRTSSISSDDGSSSRSTNYSYSSDSGYLESHEDGVGEHQYSRDVLGCVVQWTRADQQVVAIDYDANGNVISIAPPTKPAHTMSWRSTRVPL